MHFISYQLHGRFRLIIQCGRYLWLLSQDALTSKVVYRVLDTIKTKIDIILKAKPQLDFGVSLLSLRTRLRLRPCWPSLR
jgi:hypothetical protein